MNDFDNKQICSYKDIDRFGFTCDVCGRKVNGCHYINGMSFCEKCYQETFGKDNQQNEIQQLKQQLAEKDKEIESLKNVDDIWFDSYQYSVDTLKGKLKEIKLNQTQLAINELGKARKRIYALMYQENKCLNKEDCITDCLEVIDKQIKMLKKEI